MYNFQQLIKDLNSYSGCKTPPLPVFKVTTISFVISLRLSVHMEQLGSHWTDFHKILYLRIFRKSVEEIQVSLKSDNKTGTLHEDHVSPISS